MRLSLRRKIRTRDNHACLSCQRPDMLTNHPRTPNPSTPADFITLCCFCAEVMRADRNRALALGYTIHHESTNFPAYRIPVLEGWSGIWWLLGVDGGRDAILASLAGELLLYAGNLRYEMEVT
jgi:hypothetical protein